MRIIFLILCFWAPLVCTSQDDKPPTQKEIEAQKQEALNEAKQQAADLKKDIAEAKAKKEDPESIREMEKQLTTLENMVAMLEKTSLSGKQRSMESSPTKNIESKYVSPFTPIVLKQPVSIPTEKEATDQLLWYRGKKIDANTLITISGTVVRYDRTNHRIIYEPNHQPGPDTTHSYYGLLHTLKQTRQMKNLFVSQVDGMMNSFFMYPQVQAAYDEFDLISGGFYDLAVNTINRPQVYAPFDIEKMIKDLTAYANSLTAINKIILPPRRPNNNCICEIPDEVVKYKKELTSWLEVFFNEELELIHKIIEIIDEIEYVKSHGDKIPNFYFASYFIMAYERANIKLEKLLNVYTADLENILLEDGLAYAKRGLEHLAEKFDLKTLSTMTRSSEYSRSQDIFKEIKIAVFSQEFEDYIDVHKNFKDFNIVFDYGLYVSHEYNKRSLAPGYNVNDNIMKWLQSLEDFNRFTLSIDIDFQYEQDPGGTEPLMIAQGELYSDKITVSLGIEQCLLNLRVTDANYRDRNGNEEKLKIPLKIKNGRRNYVGQKIVPYTGPPTVAMLFPRFKLSFCGDPSEVKLNLLTYKMSDVQKHQGDDPKKVYTIDLLAYANKMFLGLIKTQMNMNDLVNTAGTAMNMNNPSLPKSTGNAKLDASRVEFLLNLKRYDVEYHLAATTHTEKTIIKLGILNPKGSPIIGQNPVDLVDPLDKDKVVKMQVASITLELTHTPR